MAEEGRTQFPQRSKKSSDSGAKIFSGTARRDMFALAFGKSVSNPTIKYPIIDTISAMDFALYTKMPHFCPFTAHFGGFEGVFSCINEKSAILYPGKTRMADFVSFKGSIVQGIKK